MSVFRYKMQSILNIKLKMETQAKQEFAMAKLALDEEEQKLQDLILRKESYEEEARGKLKGGLPIEELRRYDAVFKWMKESIKEQKTRVQIASAALERARIKLQEAMQERKTQEMLREKAFDEFMREENRKEMKEIDELTSYTYGQKAGGV